MYEKEIGDAYINQFKNKLYGLLCEYEKKGEWEKFLDSLLIELLGYPEESRGINYYTLYSKISSLRYLNYKYFRTTVFECMNIISKI